MTPGKMALAELHVLCVEIVAQLSEHGGTLYEKHAANMMRKKFFTSNYASTCR